MNNTADIDKLHKIIENILTHPNNHKYRSIKLSVLSKKLKDLDSALQYLYNAGFKKSSNGKQLIWEKHEENMRALNSVNVSVTTRKQSRSTEYEYKESTHETS